MEPLLTEKEVSNRLRLAEQTLRNWRFNGTGPAYIKLGRAVRYRQEDIESYAKEATVRPEQ